MTALCVLAFLASAPTDPSSPAKTMVQAPLAEGLSRGLPAERRVAYRWPQVWRAALRMLRVDRGWTIEDQSEEAGYVLFLGPQDSGIRGSLELISLGNKDSAAGIRLRAQVQNAGTHAAFSLLEALERKLREDFGPPSPPPAKDKAPAPDTDKKKKKKN